MRRLYPASLVLPARLRELLRETAAQPAGGRGHNYEYGYGVLDVAKLLAALEREFGADAGGGGDGRARRPRKKAKPARAGRR